MDRVMETWTGKKLLSLSVQEEKPYNIKENFITLQSQVVSDCYFG